MNGAVTVICVKHSVRCQLRGGRIWHSVWGVTGYCDSEQFTVTRSRQVGLESALNELRATERAAGS